MNTAEIIASRRRQLETSLTDSIQKVLEDAAEKGGETLSPVHVAGQVMPELVALCWHFLDAHKGFYHSSDSSLGEEFTSGPR
jgi:hypothetical protein